MENRNIEYELKFGKNYSETSKKIVCGHCENSIPDYLYVTKTNSAIFTGEVSSKRQWKNRGKNTNKGLKMEEYIEK